MAPGWPEMAGGSSGLRREAADRDGERAECVPGVQPFSRSRTLRPNADLGRVGGTLRRLRSPEGRERGFHFHSEGFLEQGFTPTLLSVPLSIGVDPTVD
jgi:hypothetical protein